MARSLPSGRYVIIPDLQAPYHDQRALDNVCTWITRTLRLLHNGKVLG